MIRYGHGLCIPILHEQKSIRDYYTLVAANQNVHGNQTVENKEIGGRDDGRAMMRASARASAAQPWEYAKMKSHGNSLLVLLPSFLRCDVRPVPVVLVDSSVSYVLVDGTLRSAISLAIPPAFVPDRYSLALSRALFVSTPPRLSSSGLLRLVLNPR